MKRKEPYTKVLEAQNINRGLKGNNECANQCTMFCINFQCKNKSSFICADKKCQCRKQHLQCQKYQINHLRNSINQKLFNIYQWKNQVQKICDQIIGQISALRAQSLLNIQKITINSNLNEAQRKFFNSFTNLSQFFKSNEDKRKEKMKKAHKNQNPQQTQKIITDALILFQKGSKYQIKMLRKKLEEQLFNIQNSRELEISYSETIKIIGKSNILRNNAEIIPLICFFQKKIKSMKLLFKASENGFEMQKFRSKYGQQQNTIIICQTNKDKIIGGYTPLSHVDEDDDDSDSDDEDSSGQKPILDKFQCDTTNSSFLFSLTNNDKFILEQNKHAIKKCEVTKKIWFGNDGQFVICDKANTVNLCQSSLKNQQSPTYHNKKYTNSIYSYLYLNGNDNQYFTVKQWQAWKVQFTL